MNEEIKEILEDLNILFKKDEIDGREFNAFLRQLKSTTVKHYLKSLGEGSKPESALREDFFSNETPLAKFLFKGIYPEVNRDSESGFIDYLMENGEVGIEVKPLYKAEFSQKRSGLNKIKKEKLDWMSHEEQIRKYLGSRGEFVILTNLEEWYFFSKNFSLDKDFKYFAKVNLFELIKEYERVGDFLNYIDMQEELAHKEPLDKKFFNSLKTWVEELQKIKFNVNEKIKTKFIIELINKFIFIQTLDNFRVIDKNHILESWSALNRKWRSKGELIVIEKFLKDIDEFFYEYYDTELFRLEENILDYIDKTSANIKKFYKALALVLGVDYGKTFTGWTRGILQYNFKKIDEDVLGKAYETFLAEVRKEQGIYYTPKYISQYIVKNTVERLFDVLLIQIRENLQKKQFNECKNLVHRWISIKILDPACGSGSFLIKALRIVWHKYEQLKSIIQEEKVKYIPSDLIAQTHSDELIKIKEIEDMISFKNKREGVSKILLRHIYGVDLDINALEVAKVNLWLEAIKLAPAEFKYDRLPEDTNHILPDLEMNLSNGDSLVGLPEDEIIKFFKKKHKEELKKLFELRKEYLDDPTKEEAIKEINEIKMKLSEELNKKFKKYLEENNLSIEILKKTKPLHWALDFWFVFFDKNLEVKPKEEQGFDAVVGNPPYVNIYSISKDKKIVKYYQFVYHTAIKKFDLYILFSEKSLKLLKRGGYHSFIIPDKWMYVPYGKNLRKLFLNIRIIEIRDLTNIKVFEDPVVKNVIYIVSNNVPVNEVTIKKDINEQKIEEWCLSPKLWAQHPKMMFRLLKKQELSIINKCLQAKYKWKDFFYVNWGCRPVPFYEYFIKEDNKKFDPIICKKAVKGEHIERYYIRWEGTYLRYIPEELYNPMFPELFENKGIYIKDIGGNNRITASLNEGEFYTTHTVNVSVPWKDIPVAIKKKNETYLELPCEYALGIVNSALMSFYYLKYLSDFLHTVPDNVKEFPIVYADEDVIEIISKLVEKLITLKKLQHKFRELWRYYSRKFRSTHKSLEEILIEDKRNIQRGNFDSIWISEASNYPDEQNELWEKVFKKFKILGEGDNKLKIYGIDRQKEELLLEITTSKKIFRDIIYLELLELIESRVKKNTLKDILSKSEISVIQPNIWEKSGNLLEITKEKFKEYLKEESFEVEEDDDIVKIDNTIQEVDNLIDAYVFKLYGLTKEEAEIVLDSLNIVDSVKKNILRKFLNIED